MGKGCGVIVFYLIHDYDARRERKKIASPMNGLPVMNANIATIDP
jgi:hypothetical protein